MPEAAKTSLTRFAPAERRQAVLDAAREVFCESGLAGARTKVIAERAGVAEGMVFKYFKTKENLFEESVVEVLEQLVIQVESAAREFAAASGSRGRVTHARHFHTQAAELMVEIAPLLGAVMADSGTKGTGYYGRLVAPSITRIADALSISMTAVPKPVDARMLALIFFGSHYFIALDSRHRGRPRDPELVAEELTELLSHGFGREPRANQLVDGS